MRNPRTETSQSAYDDFKQKVSPEDAQRFNFADETIVTEYKHWLIIKNRFPYDTMTRVNDMLVSRREVSSFKDLTKEELAEYEEILDDIAEKVTYDAKIQNFSQVQSVSKHLHVHLVCWHNTA